MYTTEESSQKISEEVMRNDLMKFFIKRALLDFRELRAKEEKFEDILNYFSKRELLVMIFALCEQNQYEQNLLEGGENE